MSIKVKPFDPKETDWYAFRMHFMNLADQAAWSERTRVTRLICALQGSMAGVTAGLPHPIRLEALLAQVDGLYGLMNAEEDAALKLQGLHMEANESVTMYAERVRQLCFRAYPGTQKATVNSSHSTPSCKAYPSAVSSGCRSVCVDMLPYRKL